MVGKVRQPMANTNHKFPMMGGGGGGTGIPCEMKSTVLANLNSHQLRVLCSLSH